MFDNFENSSLMKRPFFSSSPGSAEFNTQVLAFHVGQSEKEEEEEEEEKSEERETGTRRGSGVKDFREKEEGMRKKKEKEEEKM
ncbi:hypothetical protein E2C01_097515 [Portunus trituberculatus]|uniref:Uncharacterized protein n=1 Tax=Portunus trituberculatus TaxID=210409 RepID=A0A5B7K0M1_PORTR|nr:hypothetical protein [Portunus trituberculatus]